MAGKGRGSEGGFGEEIISIHVTRTCLPDVGQVCVLLSNYISENL
jgi:hypothetical protein